MASLESIKSEIVKTDIVIGKLVARRSEIESLPKILFNDESIKAVLTGKFKDQEVVLIATSHRMLCIAASSWLQFPYKDVSYIRSSKMEFEDGKRLDTVQFITPDGKVEFRYIPFDSSSFVGFIRQNTANNKPPKNITSSQAMRSSKKGNRKKVFFYLTTAVLLFGGIYFSMGLFLTKSSSASLGYTPPQFQERWNSAGRDLHSEYTMNNLKEVSDGENKSFTYFLTPDLKMMGIVQKDDMIKKIVLIGKSTPDLPLILEQVLLVIDEKLSKQDRENLLHNLGVFNDKKEDQQIANGNIRYSILYPDKIGIDFEASAIGK